MLVMREKVGEAELLSRLDLEPLAVAVPGDDALVAMVQNHNSRVAKLKDRISMLTADRERLADPCNWQNSCSADIRAARARVRTEGWDTLVGLRQVLTERGQLLARAEDGLQKQRQRLVENLERAVAKAEKSLAGELRELRRVNPAHCGLRFREMVEADANVQAAAIALDEAEASVASVERARYRLQAADSAVLVRQREVFQEMVQ